MGNQLKNIQIKSTTKSNGITLIVLVITIVVLLILAGVSIAMLTGSNGILIQAKLAKENTALAKEDEENKLANNNEYINEQLGNAVPGKVVTETKKDNYVDSNGDKATIPEGFSVDETENMISKGLVVHGPDKANEDNGSEFVWVPVPDINNMAQCSTAGGNCNLQLEDGVLKCKAHDNNKKIVGKIYATVEGESFGNANIQYSENSGLREPAIITGNSAGQGTTYDKNVNYNNNVFTLESLKQDYKNMTTSVAKYGGFYVGRYETSLVDAREDTEGTGEKIQSKSGVIPTSAANSATAMWYGLYKVQNRTYLEKNGSVESSMIWGSQYDRIINWASEGEDSNKLKSMQLGNHSGDITITGNEIYKDDCINNIKDLGGNLREWTLEASYTAERTLRGGTYKNNNTISFRTLINPNSNRSHDGSRMTLYIKQ